MLTNLIFIYTLLYTVPSIITINIYIALLDSYTCIQLHHQELKSLNPVFNTFFFLGASDGALSKESTASVFLKVS